MDPRSPGSSQVGGPHERRPAEQLVGDEPAEAIEPLCEDVQTWVEHVYAPVYIRKISQSQRWCPSWWAHGEAIIRLTALWRSWEAARVSEDATGMIDWLRNCFDAINPVLLAADGPFSSCTNDRHSDQAPMPTSPAPPGHWAHTEWHRIHPKTRASWQVLARKRVGRWMKDRSGKHRPSWPNTWPSRCKSPKR